MAFKLTKKLREEIDACVTASETAREALVAAVEKFNDALAEAKTAVEEAQSKYNEELQQTRDALEGIADDMQSEYDDKSEKWQEGDRASSVSEWIDTIRDALSEFEDADITLPDDIEAPSESVAVDLEDESNF